MSVLSTADVKLQSTLSHRHFALFSFVLITYRGDTQNKNTLKRVPFPFFLNLMFGKSFLNSIIFIPPRETKNSLKFDMV